MSRKIKPATPLSLFPFLISTIVLIFTIVVFEINGWNHNSITFFFFSMFSFAYLISLILEYHEIDVNSRRKRLKLRSNILSIFTYTVIFLFIGSMHILGNLHFPDFVIIDGWKDGYVIATRIAWFVAGFLSYLFSRSLDIDLNKPKTVYKEGVKITGNRFRSVSFPEALVKILLFPVISVPAFISIADFLGFSFIRHFVTTFILGRIT
ncbi:MAG: hypothetical protein F6J95_026255 [Leptolyngbya sp. SIO1E4]|nr:hypothetical protein [Leptolyngbya sp. SIO1E4]